MNTMKPLYSGIYNDRTVIENMAETKKEEKKITVNIRGKWLIQAIEVRQKREREAGTVVSVTAIINDAITELYNREIGKKAI